MTNVTRQSSSPVNTDLVYYLVQSYDDNDDDNVSLTTADDTCQLMMSVSEQRAAIILGYVIVTLCQGVFTASLSVSLSVCLSVRSLFVCLFVFLFVCLYVSVSVSWFVCFLSVHLYSMFVCFLFLYLFVSLFFHLTVCLFVCPSVCLSFSQPSSIGWNSLRNLQKVGVVTWAVNVQADKVQKLVVISIKLLQETQRHTEVIQVGNDCYYEYVRNVKIS